MPLPSSGAFQAMSQAEAHESKRSWADSSVWDMAWNAPLLGKGIRNSNAYSQNFGADRAGRTIHNQYLQVAADSGIPAAGCYVAMLLVGGIGLGRARRACLEKQDEIEGGPNEPDPAVLDRVRSAGMLCLAIQTGLLMFAMAGMFLSMELVEVPWLLITLAGIAPVAVQQYLNRIKNGVHVEDEDEEDDTPHRLTPPPIPMPKAA